MMRVDWKRDFIGSFMRACVALGIMAWVSLAEGQVATVPANGPAWENITENLIKGIPDASDPKKWWDSNTTGLMVDPGTGDVYVNIAPKGGGFFVSKDQGATWTLVANTGLKGRCESAFSVSFPYPYDGRMIVATLDGICSGTVDKGATWTPWPKYKRGFDYVDADWSAAKPQVLFGLEHEPWWRCVSTDGGLTWKRLDQEDKSGKTGQTLKLGVVNATTLLQADSTKDGIFRSTDLGQSWKQVADYRVLGCRPVHYGKKLYWATTKGLIVSEDGSDWRNVGAPLSNATFGPYFGKSEDEMMVVAKDGFYLTADGGKTWQKAAPYFTPPDARSKGYNKDASGRYYGWDSVRHILYASHLGSSAYRLKLNSK